MDLLQTVRKEGSRGGRGEFKWEDVKNDAHRENYLGHSLMAPVGRWQKNKDLSWYAKSNAEGKQLSEAEARKEEIRKIKEAESDALARALGYDVPARSSDNPNMTALGGDKSLQKTIKDSVGNHDSDEAQESDGKGLGYGGFGGAAIAEEREEIMEGVGTDEMLVGPRRGDQENERHSARAEAHERHHRRRSRDHQREHRRHHRRERSRERERERRWEPRSRSRSRSRSNHRKRDHRERRHRSRDRRRSPREFRDDDRGRHRRRSRSRSPRRDRERERYDEERGRRR